MRKVFFYPEFRSKAEFDDVVTRAAWYYEPWLNSISELRLAVDFEFSGSVERDPRVDPRIDDKIPVFLKKSTIELLNGAGASAFRNAAENQSDLLLVWKLPEDERARAEVERVYSAVRQRGGLSYILDKDREMSHGCHWLWSSITLATPEERQALHADSFAALQRFAKQLTQPRAYVLGTGPNLELASDKDFSDGHCIIANSIVKNRELMDRLDPVAVTACDPIFHAGPSLYASEFRDELVAAMDDYPRMFFFAPHRDQKIYLKNLPPRLHHRLIFVPIDTDPGAAWNFDLRRSFYLVPEGNVLTQMMLPIAAAFFDKISVIGCDGRPLSENKYFWSHHQKSQFNDKMSNIQEVHPAFFSKRDYDDHYAEHCEDVERIINTLEKAGKTVDTLTDSYVPALSRRYALDWRSLDNICVVSINPNLRNIYGHLKAYDDGLRQATLSRGGGFRVLASRELNVSEDSALEEGGSYTEAVFSDNVYCALTRQLSAVDQDAILRFEAEFEASVIRHKSQRPGVRHAYYLYMGSLPHAIAMANVCVRHTDISGSLTTFGECIMDCTEAGHIDAWAEFLRSIEAQPNFEVTAITKQVKQIVSKRCGVELRLLPHPSASFTDQEFDEWFHAVVNKPLPEDRITLLSPGGFWGEKNFDLTCDIMKAAAESSIDFHCKVRTGPLESADREQLAARETLRQYAETADGMLSDADYLGLFRDADIAVLTYRRQDWRDRNSSVLVDCLYAGVPMVVSSRTWLGDLVEHYGCGIAVEDETREAYFGAVEAIRQDLTRFRSRTIEAAKSYQASNRFLDVLGGALSPLWVSEHRDKFTPYDPHTIPVKLEKLREHAISGWRTVTMSSSQDAISQSVPAPCASQDHEPTPIRFELPREADCMFEELDVAQSLFEAWGFDPRACVMIDVGAHSGGSFPPFVDAGWTVFGFEPDPSNRAEIPERYLENPRFHIDPRALADKVQQDVPFFASPESTGISGLSAFRDTHEEVARVSTTTLANAMREYDMPPVNLLKVDTEGFDLFVLKGMDFDRCKPEVIITEFENNKTLPLGYHYRDQIALLEAQGYTVWVSEWWPIVRYGIRHHWRSLYPASLRHPPEDSWGNFIAFRDPPLFRDVYNAMIGAINRPHNPAAVPIAEARIHGLSKRVERVDPSERCARAQTIENLHTSAPRLAQRTSEPRASRAPAWDAKAQQETANVPHYRLKRLLQFGALAGGMATLALWTLLVLSLQQSGGPLRDWTGVLGGLSVLAGLGITAAIPAAYAFRKRNAIYDRLRRHNLPLLTLITSFTSLLRLRKRLALVTGFVVATFAVLSASLIGAALGERIADWIAVLASVIAISVSLAAAAVWTGGALALFVRRSWVDQAHNLRVMEERLRDFAEHSARRQQDDSSFRETHARIDRIVESTSEYLEELRTGLNNNRLSLTQLESRVRDESRAVEGLSERLSKEGAYAHELSKTLQRVAAEQEAIEGNVATNFKQLSIEIAERAERLASDQATLEGRLDTTSKQLSDEVAGQIERLDSTQQALESRMRQEFSSAIEGASKSLAATLAEEVKTIQERLSDARLELESGIESARSETDDVKRGYGEFRRRAQSIEQAQRVLEEIVSSTEGELGVLRERFTRSEASSKSRHGEMNEALQGLEERLRRETGVLREFVESEIAGKIADYDRRQHNARAALHGEVMESVNVELASARRELREDLESIAERVSGVNRNLDDVFKSLAGQSERVANVDDRIERTVKDLSEVSRALENFSVQVANIEKKVGDASAGDEEIAQLKTDVTQQISKAGERIEDLRSQVEAAKSAAVYTRKSAYLNFNRVLSDQSADRLLGWADKLKIKADRNSLAYMAHRVNAIEDMSIGRMAASVETQIFRTLAARSIKQKKLRLLEIGTLYGVGLSALYEHVSSHFTEVDCTVIDPFEGYYGTNADPVTGELVTRANFDTNLRRLGIPEDAITVVQHLSESREAMDAVAGSKFNFFLIDGDHSYHGVKRDFENYASLLPRNAIVVVDDYGTAEYEGINRYVENTMKKHPNLTFVGADFNTAVFRIKSAIS